MHLIFIAAFRLEVSSSGRGAIVGTTKKILRLLRESNSRPFRPARKGRNFKSLTIASWPLTFGFVFRSVALQFQTAVLARDRGMIDCGGGRATVSGFFCSSFFFRNRTWALLTRSSSRNRLTARLRPPSTPVIICEIRKAIYVIKCCVIALYKSLQSEQ